MDAGTGDLVVMYAKNAAFCPDEKSKKDLFSIAVWAKGVSGDVDLRIQLIVAYGYKRSKSKSESTTTNGVAAAAAAAAASNHPDDKNGPII